MTRFGLSPAEMGAIVVTRGDVDLGPVVESLSIFGEVIVWDNTEAVADLAVFGRYRAIRNVDASYDAVYVQDDDCILHPTALHRLCLRYEPGKLTANMPDRFRKHYPDSCLVGFGAIFDRRLPAVAFRKFARHAYPVESPSAGPSGAWLARYDPTFPRTCDVVFSGLTERVLVDVPYEDREFASDSSRMWRQPGHVGERLAMLERVRACR